MEVEDAQITINDSIAITIQGHGLNYKPIYRELKEGIQRPRLNESSIDPDLMDHDFLSRSRVVDRWTDNSTHTTPRKSTNE